MFGTTCHGLVASRNDLLCLDSFVLSTILIICIVVVGVGGGVPHLDCDKIFRAPSDIQCQSRVRFRAWYVVD